MQLINQTVRRDWHLYLIGDAHKGSIYHHDDGFREAVSIIAEDRTSKAVFMGDGVDAKMSDNRHFRLDAVNPKCPTPLEQAKDLARTLKPIQRNLVTYLVGKHESDLHRFGDVVEEVCERLRIVQGTYSSIISFLGYNKKLQFKIYVEHGCKVMNSNAADPHDREKAKQKALKSQLRAQQFGDVAIMAKGHAHQLLIVEPTHELYLTTNGGEIKQNYVHNAYTQDYIHPDLRWYACTGCFYKKYGELGTSSYVETAGYSPTETGMIKFTIENGIPVAAEKVIL